MNAASGEAIRVVVADDHPLFRAGVVASLREEPGLDVIGEAGDARRHSVSRRSICPTLRCSTSPCPAAA